MAPARSSFPSFAQIAMEFPPLISIYESRLWRRNPAFSFAFGISFDREFSLVAQAAQLAPELRLLDLACGPGIYARRFARELGTGVVCGLDLSLPMLRWASRRATREGLTNLILARSDAGELPFDDAYFDIVNCCGALHLFPDVPRVLGEVSRVLRKGGRFTTAVFKREIGRLYEIRDSIRRAIYGVRSFSEPQLVSEIEAAGMIETRTLHARGIWMIMSARKPQ
jgi:ubiquinone/menaquinone biosynthesis C-methylase UbiE